MYKGINSNYIKMKKQFYETPDLALIRLDYQPALCSSGTIESLNENEYPGGENWGETL